MSNKTTKLGYEQIKEKPTEAFLSDEYPHKACEDVITDIDSLEPDIIYEMKCSKCKMSIRSLGKNLQRTIKMINVCIGCGNESLFIRRVDMSLINE